MNDNEAEWISRLKGPLVDNLDNQTDDEDTVQQRNSPTWVGYNSLVSKKFPLTRVIAPTLLPAPSHEWQA